MNIKEIKELLQLMKEHGLTEVEIEKDGLKLKLKKSVSGKTMADYGTESAPVVLPFPMAQSAQGVDAAGQDRAAAAQAAEGVEQIRSPMVGTFYAAPAPDQPPYVTVGQTIKKGDVLCIVEAMKLMNEIKSEVNGTVTEIMVNNGQAVEFDQPLFKIKTT